MRFLQFSILIALCAIRSATLASEVDFEREIRPILNEHCIRCHGVEKQRGSLRFDFKADAFHGGEDGPAIVPNQPEKSLLLDRLVSHDPDEIMPPPKKGEKLSDTEIAKIRTWIEGGAPWPDDPTPAERLATAKKHWAFIPPVRPTPPAGGNPIDAFVSARQAEHELKPAPEADRRTLLRRVTLDLTGLPPTPEELESFLDDPAPGAYERVVDRLLASPRYGERWGRFWLDLARWAESDGYEANEIRPTAWRYRDYVVRAFNSDKPYDQFLREQIAGDELTPYSDEALIATGFLAAARTNDNEEDKAMQLNGPLVDVTNTVASVTLGLTLGCAQCHDHKIEPLTARDYYSLHAFFLRGQTNVLLLQGADLWAAWERGKPRELDAARKLRDVMENGARDVLRRDWLAKLNFEQRTAVEIPAEERNADQKQIAAEAQKSLDFSKEKVRGSLSEEDRKLLADLEKKIEGLEKHGQDLMPQTWGFYSPATSPNGIVNLTPKGMYPFPYKPDDLRTKAAAVLKRGDVHRPDEAVTPAWPAVLGPTPKGTKTRSQLVDWLVSPANPLTARVWANFIWQQHFGRGIVETSGDFGTHGAAPSNRELLDWLACELRENGWSTKHLQRLIVTSQTYRESSVSDPANLARDPKNQWLWHWSPRRLEA
ncbi:MAG TPA: PSD1 and planctomycete cytochrome C domain-containing protein, partial [Chthoniobacteraceae bacterium]